MNFDYIVIFMTWIVSAVVLFLAVPRKQVREFVAVLMFFQSLTWIFSIVMTEFDFMETNTRIFDRATKINFTSEFVFYPTIAVVFHRLFPKQGGIIKVALHYLLFVGGIILYMFLLGKFTNIMEVNFHHLIRAFFNFTFELWLTRRYIGWLVSKIRLQKNDEVRVEEWK